MSNNKNNIWGGVILIALGLGFLLDQLGVFHGLGFGWILGNLWPLIIIIIGISLFRKGNTGPGIFFIALGGFFLLSEIVGWNIWATFWPLIIIFVGVSVLLGRAVIPVNLNRAEKESGKDILDDLVIFWGSNKKITATDFRGGNVTCIFGGSELDLSNAKIIKKDAVLNVSAIFGGIKIRVPDDSPVVSEGSAILGGWEEKFSSKSDKKQPKLIIKGSAVFGAVELWN